MTARLTNTDVFDAYAEVLECTIEDARNDKLAKAIVNEAVAAGSTKRIRFDTAEQVIERLESIGRNVVEMVAYLRSVSLNRKAAYICPEMAGCGERFEAPTAFDGSVTCTHCGLEFFGHRHRAPKFVIDERVYWNGTAGREDEVWKIQAVDDASVSHDTIVHIVNGDTDARTARAQELRAA